MDLYAHDGSFIARGLYNSRSKIRLRLYSWSPETPLDAAFFRDRLAAAIRLRREILGLDGPGRACRLVFSEADGLSGLIVDSYDRWLVVQFTSLALAQRRELLIELLVELVSPEGIYQRTERGIGKLEGLELQDELLWGSVPTEPVTIEEGDLRFPSQSRGRAKDRLLPGSTGQSPGRCAAWPRAVECWMLFAIPAASACTPPVPGPPKSWAWMLRSPCLPWPPKTHVLMA